MKIGYARVSKQEQNLDRQIISLREAGAEVIYTEKMTGKHMNRPELEKMLASLRKGDVVIIHDLTRLSRKLSEVLFLVDKIHGMGADFKSLKEDWLDTTNPSGKLIFHIFAALAQFEREQITSKGTLDKQNDYVRRYIAERANFLGAIRLPNSAFKANASTEVTTDIIFLQKKSDITQEDSQNWLSLKELPNSDILVNEYFADNPHMMLGTMEQGGGLYGNENETTLVSDGRALKEAIAQAVSFLPAHVYSSIELSADIEEEIKTKIPANPSVKNYGYTLQPLTSLLKVFSLSNLH